MLQATTTLPVAPAAVNLRRLAAARNAVLDAVLVRPVELPLALAQFKGPPAVGLVHRHELARGGAQLRLLAAVLLELGVQVLQLHT